MKRLAFAHCPGAGEEGRQIRDSDIIGNRSQGRDGEGSRDAGAMMEYFAPLKTWLDEQNKGTLVGWKSGN